jgi:hypothetical protein
MEVCKFNIINCIAQQDFLDAEALLQGAKLKFSKVIFCNLVRGIHEHLLQTLQFDNARMFRNIELIPIELDDVFRKNYKDALVLNRLEKLLEEDSDDAESFFNENEDVFRTQKYEDIRRNFKQRRTQKIKTILSRFLEKYEFEKAKHYYNTVENFFAHSDYQNLLTLYEERQERQKQNKLKEQFMQLQFEKERMREQELQEKQSDERYQSEIREADIRRQTEQVAQVVAEERHREFILGPHELLKRTDWQRFDKVIEQENIRFLVHVTDISNLESIKRYGLYSKQAMEDFAIQPTHYVSNVLSRELDGRRGIYDYIHLSLQKAPMFHVAEQEGRIRSIELRIDPMLIYAQETKFSDKNATDNSAHVGDAFEDFEKINFKIANGRERWSSEEEKKLFQAEILVKHHIPKEFIEFMEVIEF